jgi:hypothetical protein
MSHTDEEQLSFEQALMRVHDRCGREVQLKVVDPDGIVLAVRGELQHQPLGRLWAHYRVGEANLDLTTFEPYDCHWAHDYMVGFMTPDGQIRVEVYDL